jgi:hypothetical protein
MCRRARFGSRRVILNSGLRQHAVPEVGAEELGGVELDALVEEVGELSLQAEEGQAGDVAGFELDEDVDIAVRAEVLAQDRAEEGEAADVVPATEGLEAAAGDVDSGFHGGGRPGAYPTGGSLEAPADEPELYTCRGVDRAPIPVHRRLRRVGRGSARDRSERVLVRRSRWSEQRTKQEETMNKPRWTGEEREYDESLRQTDETTNPHTGRAHGRPAPGREQGRRDKFIHVHGDEDGDPDTSEDRYLADQGLSPISVDSEPPTTSTTSSPRTTSTTSSHRTTSTTDPER